jgi:hypothetical protein
MHARTIRNRSFAAQYTSTRVDLRVDEARHHADSVLRWLLGRCFKNCAYVVECLVTKATSNDLMNELGVGGRIDWIRGIGWTLPVVYPQRPSSDLGIEALGFLV